MEPNHTLKVYYCICPRAIRAFHSYIPRPCHVCYSANCLNSNTADRDRKQAKKGGLTERSIAARRDHSARKDGHVFNSKLALVAGTAYVDRSDQNTWSTKIRVVHSKGKILRKAPGGSTYIMGGICLRCRRHGMA